MSTISTTITQGVTLGSVNSYPTFASPLTITATGVIDPDSPIGSANAIYGDIANASVVNQGTLEAGFGGAGVVLGAGGSVTNATATGLIEGYVGVAMGSHSTVTNASGIITNSGIIKGAFGIRVFDFDLGNNTVVNSGTVTGTSGTAVQFGHGNDTLVVEPGARFNGAVSGGGGMNTVVQGASGTLKVTGFSAFETIRLANGSADSLTLKSANFTNVGGNVITVFDGNSGNAVTASTLPSADAIIVHAGTGADTLRGGAGNDSFFASDKTTMTGGAGANRFTFADIGANRITDFAASASNELVLRKSGFNLGADESLAAATPKHLAASVFVANSTGSFTTTSQRFAYNTTTGALRYSAKGSGSAGKTVVVLTGHPSLRAGSTGNLFFTS